MFDCVLAVLLILTIIIVALDFSISENNIYRLCCQSFILFLLGVAAGLSIYSCAANPEYQNKK